MIIRYTKSYDKTLKKIKKNNEATLTLEEIINYIEYTLSFKELEINPISKIYNFERLKYNNNEFYSFRLTKLIRLIVTPSVEGNSINLCYISTKHYEDFNKDKVIYYEKE